MGWWSEGLWNDVEAWWVLIRHHQIFVVSTSYFSARIHKAVLVQYSYGGTCPLRAGQLQHALDRHITVMCINALAWAIQNEKFQYREWNGCLFPCNPDCVCPKILNPVCGNDGVTYNNKCLAKCNNVEQFKCENECGKCGGDKSGKMLRSPCFAPRSWLVTTQM